MIENGKNWASPSLLPSYAEACDRAKHQIDRNTFDSQDQEWLDEIMAIMSEVYSVPANSRIRISGEWLPSETVKSVFAKLTDMHIKTVIMQYNSVREPIRNPKAYMRTLLYNSVFSDTAFWQNRVRSDGVM